MCAFIGIYLAQESLYPECVEDSMYVVCILLLTRFRCCWRCCCRSCFSYLFLLLRFRITIIVRRWCFPIIATAFSTSLYVGLLVYSAFLSRFNLSFSPLVQFIYCMCVHLSLGEFHSNLMHVYLFSDFSTFTRIVHKWHSLYVYALTLYRLLDVCARLNIYDCSWNKRKYI